MNDLAESGIVHTSIKTVAPEDTTTTFSKRCNCFRPRKDFRAKEEYNKATPQAHSSSPSVSTEPSVNSPLEHDSLLRRRRDGLRLRLGHTGLPPEASKQVWTTERQKVLIHLSPKKKTFPWTSFRTSPGRTECPERQMHGSPGRRFRSP